MHNADTNTDTTDAAATEATDNQATSADRHAFTPITTQEDLDKVIGARLARERDKYADYDDLKAAASKLADAEARLAQIDAQAALEKIRNDVAQEAGVPARLDQGRTDRTRIRARGGVEGAAFGACDSDAGGDPECLRR